MSTGDSLKGNFVIVLKSESANGMKFSYACLSDTRANARSSIPGEHSADREGSTSASRDVIVGRLDSPKREFYDLPGRFASNFLETANCWCVWNWKFFPKGDRGQSSFEVCGCFVEVATLYRTGRFRNTALNCVSRMSSKLMIERSVGI